MVLNQQVSNICIEFIKFRSAWNAVLRISIFYIDLFIPVAICWYFDWHLTSLLKFNLLSAFDCGSIPILEINSMKFIDILYCI